MANILHFKSRIDLTAEANMKRFISMCQTELTLFGTDLEWNSHIWPNTAVFSKLGVITRRPSKGEFLCDEFIDFAKAYLRYQQSHKPTQAKSELRALRAIDSALRQNKDHANIMSLSIISLDEAALLAKKHYSKGAAYSCGREIERLAKFVSNYNLINVNLTTWKNPIPRPSDTIKTGKLAKLIREQKLPDETALNALAEIFASDPIAERDIFTTSIFAMLMSAPSRISEILALPVDCEIQEEDNNGIVRYGWRFYSNKGYEGNIKWIPTAMVEIAKTAIKRAKKISQEARKLAIWIEENPNKFYRHKNCPNVKDNAPLTSKQACQALGLANQNRSACYTSLKNRGLDHRDNVHTLDSLWSHLKMRLPKEFPWFDKEKKVKFSNALFALNTNQLHSTRACLLTELHKPDTTFFNNDITPRLALDKAHKNIFDRYNYRSINGERLKLTSHQARHLLNTIAQRGGLSNLEIAKWSGRANIKQNQVYNHVSEYEMVTLSEKIDPEKVLFGPIGEVQQHLPVTTQDLNSLEQASVHITEYGFCVHDYTMSPCDKFRDCINCTEQVCIKGDSVKLARLKDRLEKIENLLKQNTQDHDNFGADRWYNYHVKTIHRLHELIKILENPNIEDGAQVKLRGNDFSQLRRVADKKSIKMVTENSPDTIKFNDLKETLGGGFG